MRYLILLITLNLLSCHLTASEKSKVAFNDLEGDTIETIFNMTIKNNSEDMLSIMGFEVQRYENVR